MKNITCLTLSLFVVMHLPMFSLAAQEILKNNQKLILKNNEIITIQNKKFIQTGNVILKDNAKLIIDNSYFVFNQSYHEEFEFICNDQSEFIIDNSTIISDFTYPVLVGDSSKFYVQSSNLDISDKGNGAWCVISRNSNVEILNSNVGGVWVSQAKYNFFGPKAGDFVKVSISNSNIMNLTLCWGYNTTGQISNLKPGYIKKYNINQNNQIENSMIDIEINQSTVNSYNFELNDSADMKLINCEIGSIQVTDNSNLILTNSTLYEPRLKIKKGNILNLSNLYKGFISYWDIKNQNSNNPFGFTIHDSKIIDGWYLRIRDNATINNSQIIRLRPEFDAKDSTTKVVDSFIDELMLWWHHGSIDFENTQINNMLNPDESTSYISGNVQFNNKEIPNFWGPWDNSTINREYPVYVYDKSGNPLSKVTLNLYSPENELIWVGSTNISGITTINIKFTDDNYNNSWLLTADKSPPNQKEVTVLSNSPIKFGYKDSDGDTENPIGKGLSWAVTQNWNLLSLPLIPESASPADIFGENWDDVVSLWKWGNGGWQVALPSMGQDQEEAYQENKGFASINAITSGQGFWVNAENQFQLSIQGDAPVNTFPEVFPGWNLVGLCGNSTKTVDQIVEAIDLDVQSLWKWPEGEGSWLVCLPGEEDNGTSYAQSKGFGVMQSIEPGEGFWVNCQ